MRDNNMNREKMVDENIRPKDWEDWFFQIRIFVSSDPLTTKLPSMREKRDEREMCYHVIITIYLINIIINHVLPKEYSQQKHLPILFE